MSAGQSRGISHLAIFLRLVAVFAFCVGLFLVFFDDAVFSGMFTVWLGGMMLALSRAVDAV